MRAIALFAFLGLLTGCPNPQLASFFDRLGRASNGVAMGAAAMTYPQAPLGGSGYYAPTTVYEQPVQQVAPPMAPPPGPAVPSYPSSPAIRPVSKL